MPMERTRQTFLSPHTLCDHKVLKESGTLSDHMLSAAEQICLKVYRGNYFQTIICCCHCNPTHVSKDKISSLVLPSPIQTQKHHMCSKILHLSMSFKGRKYLVWIALEALQMGAISNAPTFRFAKRSYNSGCSLLDWTVLLSLSRTICIFLRCL